MFHDEFPMEDWRQQWPGVVCCRCSVPVKWRYLSASSNTAAATTYRPGAASSYTVNIVNIDNVDMINEWY